MATFFLLFLFFAPLATQAADGCRVFLKPTDRIHVGNTTLASVWGEPLPVKLSKDQLLALVWAQTRYRINPNYLLAIAAKESRLNCQVNIDGCYQITSEALAELGMTDGRQDFSKASVIAARYLQVSREGLHLRHRFKSFVRHTADREAEAKLLARAYNRGNFDQNIAEILGERRAFCRDQADVIFCYNNHEIARDHTDAIISYCHTLSNTKSHNPTILWIDIERLIKNVIVPTEKNSFRGAKAVRQTYDRVRRGRKGVPFREIGPILSTIAKVLPKP